MKLSEVGNGMLFPPSWYGSPPDVPEPDEVDLWPWEDERDGLAERGAYDRDDDWHPPRGQSREDSNYETS